MWAHMSQRRISAFARTQTHTKSGSHYKKIARLSHRIVSWMFHSGFWCKQLLQVHIVYVIEAAAPYQFDKLEDVAIFTADDLLSLEWRPPCLGSHRPWRCTPELEDTENTLIFVFMGHAWTNILFFFVWKLFAQRNVQHFFFLPCTEPLVMFWPLLWAKSPITPVVVMHTGTIRNQLAGRMLQISV